MKKINTILFCLLVVGFVSSAQQNKYRSLKQMKWLAGHWKGMYKGAPFYESWIMVNDSLMVNLSIEIKNKDTLVKENGFTLLSEEPKRGADNKLVCFLHPKSTSGVLVELCQEVGE